VWTHGDPNLDNWLVDPHGNLHLVDWGELALAPPERDLFAFTGHRFPAFWECYQNARGRLLLRLDAFAFYFYRWTLQEIADYGTRLLFRTGAPSDAAHAWAQLQHYLPVRHESIAKELGRLRDALSGSIATEGNRT
ncbi:MAG: phosphotransferase family protein, partial [Candidatus Dormibacteraceae bacterium]